MTAVMGQFQSLSEGFQIEDPSILVRWGSTPAELKRLLSEKKSHGLLKGTGDGYTLTCAALNGLRIRMRLCFRNRQVLLGLTLKEGQLRELGLFQDSQHDLRQSYDIFQRHLEETFGKPSAVEVGSYDPSFPASIWQIGSVRIEHSVFERFVPEEHVRIVHHGRLSGG